jgi:hypothetical protein
MKSTKKEKIITLMSRPQGASLKELMRSTGGWQAHSVRGFLSTLASKDGVKFKRIVKDDRAAYIIARRKAARKPKAKAMAVAAAEAVAK